MARKITSLDLKKKLKQGEKELKKLEDLKTDLDLKIEKQIAANKIYEAEYITCLLVESDKSVDDLEELLISAQLEAGD